MRSHVPRRRAHQGRVLRAAPRRVPRAHPVPRGSHHAHQARRERLARCASPSPARRHAISLGFARPSAAPFAPTACRLTRKSTSPSSRTRRCARSTRSSAGSTRRPTCSHSARRSRPATGRWSGSGTMPLVRSPLSGEPNAKVGRYLSWVRTVGLLLVVSLVIAVSAPASAQASTAELVQQLDGLLSSFPGGAGIWVADPTITTPLFSHDPDEQVIAASLYKLGVLAEAERRVDAGDLHYGDAITIQPDDITLDGSYEDAGTQLTLDQALEAMITISDNGSALALWRILGGANIDATLEKAGIKNFHVALDDSEDNWVTPRAVGTFFTLLARRQLISAAASDRMLARLERQQINDRLPAQLPPDVLIAHKTGNLPGLTHDAGIIFTKAGPRVVVAMTWDALDEDADNFISSVGALVYGAILEPSANARYQVSKTAIAVDTGAEQRVTVPITNAGTRTWAAAGVGSVGLIWELRNTQGQLVANSAKPQTLPP